jgi:transcriptional regulator with XRE-family HTH domain
MKTVGDVIRNKREELGLLLRHVSAKLDIDQAILSKIERGERKPSKELIIQLAEVLKLDKKELLVDYLSEKIAFELANEDCATQALKIAEKKVRYIKSHNLK